MFLSCGGVADDGGRLSLVVVGAFRLLSTADGWPGFGATGTVGEFAPVFEQPMGAAAALPLQARVV